MARGKVSADASSHINISAIQILRVNPNAVFPLAPMPTMPDLIFIISKIFVWSRARDARSRRASPWPFLRDTWGSWRIALLLERRGLKTAGGVIDAGYRGEIHIVLWNISREVFELKHGERLAQLLLIPIATPAVVGSVDSLDETARGGKGFGSSGKVSQETYFPTFGPIGPRMYEFK